MSADGLSYAVATDFDKQLAQASASFDAAAKEARLNRIGQQQRGNVVDPQKDQIELDMLRRELFDPVMQSAAAYQGRSYQPERSARPISNRIINHEGNIWSVNPTQNSVTSLVTAPQKPAAELKPNFAQQTVVKDLYKQIDLNRKQQAALEGSKLQSDAAKLLSLKEDALRLEKQRRGILDQFMGASRPVATNAPAALPTASPKRYKYNPATGDFE